MAAGSLPAPGTKYGPCKKTCAHADCAAARREAAAICRICGEAIGYENAFYQEDVEGSDAPPANRIHADATVLTNLAGKAYRLVHAWEAQDEAERDMLAQRQAAGG